MNNERTTRHTSPTRTARTVRELTDAGWTLVAHGFERNQLVLHWELDIAGSLVVDHDFTTERVA